MMVMRVAQAWKYSPKWPLSMIGSGKQFPTNNGLRPDFDLPQGADKEMPHISQHRNSRLAVILFAIALLILWGNAAMAMTLNSPAFQQNGHIPSKYTCEGEDVPPPLAWEGVPPDTSLPENAGKARLPQGTLLGPNNFKKTGYGGPCPPIGRHRYFHISSTRWISR
jgi:hypothetical protein